MSRQISCFYHLAVFLAIIFSPADRTIEGVAQGLAKIVEVPGFEPGAFRMQSERDTTTPHPQKYEPSPESLLKVKAKSQTILSAVRALASYVQCAQSRFRQSTVPFLGLVSRACFPS